MKCRKCGYKNKKNVEYCVRCGTRLPKKKGRWGWILRLILLFCIIIGMSVFVLLQTGGERESNGNHEVEKNIPETDMEGITYYESSEEDVCTDGGLTYVGNEILVTLKSEDYRPWLESYLEEKGGRIVGEIKELADYQIQVERMLSYDELQSMIRELEALEWVDFATPNYAMEMDLDYIPNDTRWKNEWGKYPDGGNWGLEAIDAPGAWEYRNEMETVNVGVYDGAFYTSHEDLNFAEVPLFNDEAINDPAWNESEKKENIDHGTHTSGTIAALYNNRRGIAGIAPNVNLYGVSMHGIEKKYNFFQRNKIAFAYLIIKKKCSVVNMSVGWDRLTFNASRGSEKATNELHCYSQGTEKILHKIIDNGYEFVICKSSGNQNSDKEGAGYRYYLKDIGSEEFDDANEYLYYSEDDYTAYKEEKNKEDKSEEELKRDRYFKEHEEKGDLQVSKLNKGCLDYGVVDTKFDVLGAIRDEVVSKRIIMVGAAENVIGTNWLWAFIPEHEGYKVADFSQCGSRVDVLAPGVDVESTVKSREGYLKMSGTSMAAPHVSGVAALLFSVNPDIKADRIKEIIKQTATGNYGKEEEEKYGLLNAKNAVELALKEKEEAKTSTSDSADSKGDLSNKRQIPEDAVEYNGHYYYLYDKSDISDWYQAEEFCEEQGGYLATPTSEGEDHFLYSYLRSNKYESAYFGLMKLDSYDTWGWITGETLSYQNWAEGEPNSQEGEYYGMYYYKFNDGEWNDGDGKNTAFLCEWGAYETESGVHYKDGFNPAESERDIALVLDTSGSMSGTPIDETKKASEKFVELIARGKAQMGIVTYSSSAKLQSNFSANTNFLNASISRIDVGGGTNLEDGLRCAYEKLNDISNAKKRIIVLMSDGMPNNGKMGDALVEYADEIKQNDVIIYTLGFFQNVSNKAEPQALMEKLASDGCHYEVEDADSLKYFFGDVAAQINGQRFMYIRIACPVDVKVEYQGETLNSAERDKNTRTDFGTLTFEEEESESVNDTQESRDTEDAGEQVKVLRLKEGPDYNIRIEGTGKGRMNYTIGYMNEEGEYKDFRKFRNIEITRKTSIDTVASVSEETVLQVDQDGDGKYDLYLKAGKNGYGKEAKMIPWLMITAVSGGGSVLLLILLVCFAMRRNKKKSRG